MIRRVYRAARIVAHIAEAAFKLSFCAPRWSEARRRREIRRWSRRAMMIAGVDLNFTEMSATPGSSGVLYVANHISWIDICALMAARDTAFVAKSDILRWPIIGRIATQVGTIYIERDRRAAARLVNAEIAHRLNEGQSVCIFPEGTTTDGETLQPFRLALFDAAITAGRNIQPVAIRHLGANGRRAESAAFVGDGSLIGSIWRMLGVDGVRTELTFLPPYSAAALSRRDAATKAERAIAQSLGVSVQDRQPTCDRPRGESGLLLDYAPG